MSIIDLGNANQHAAQDEFWALRGRAIHAYANLEQSLYRLFCLLTGMSADIGGIVFFKITNAQARNKIIEKLFQKKHGTNFNLFRNSLLERLRPIDQHRNELVHWNTVMELTSQGHGLTLLPPAGWTPDSPSYDSSTFVAFIEKCNFYWRLLNMFTLITSPAASLGTLDTRPWLEIFSRPITYPPPADHPLFQMLAVPGTQPESSR